MHTHGSWCWLWLSMCSLLARFGCCTWLQLSFQLSHFCIHVSACLCIYIGLLFVLTINKAQRNNAFCITSMACICNDGGMMASYIPFLSDGWCAYSLGLFICESLLSQWECEIFPNIFEMFAGSSSWILESHFRLEGCDMNNYAGLLLAPHRLTT